MARAYLFGNKNIVKGDTRKKITFGSGLLKKIVTDRNERMKEIDNIQKQEKRDRRRTKKELESRIPKYKCQIILEAEMMPDISHFFEGDWIEEQMRRLFGYLDIHHKRQRKIIKVSKIRFENIEEIKDT